MRNKRRIGEILLEDGLITPPQINEVLSYQNALNRKILFGEACIKLGILTRNDIKNVLFKYEKHSKIGELLVQSKILEPDQLKQALNKQKESKQKLGKILIDSGFISDIDLAKALSLQLNIPYIIPKPFMIDKHLAKNGSKSYFVKHHAIPAFKADDVVTVIMADPLDYNVLRDLNSLFKLKVEPAIGATSQITKVLNHIYSGFVFSQLSAQEERYEYDKDLVIKWKDSKDVEKDRFVDLINFIIMDAVDQSASDLHIEPQSNLVRVRYRVDGMLVHYTDLPKSWGRRTAARIKAICGLDIADKRRHQDGRIQANIQGKEVDLRVSTYVTVYGENIVIRILNRITAFRELKLLGMNARTLDRYKKKLPLPIGVTIVTGPTGSGKTTTLYASLDYLNQIDKKIITVEDPVELTIEGIVQGEYNPLMDVTYEDFIKSMMRQDPDILMIGEIRDKQTANATVKASLTGHRVFSSFHSDDTTGALLRLMDMGIDTYLISSTIISLLSQRLVRCVCPHCKQEYKPDIDLLGIFDVKGLDYRKHKFYRGKGCDECNHTGYRKRIGVFEFLPMNDDIRDAIRAKKTSAELRYIARRKAKLISMAEDGLYKALKGITTIEEVLRVVYRNEGDSSHSFTVDEIFELCENKSVRRYN